MHYLFKIENSCYYINTLLYPHYNYFDRASFKFIDIHKCTHIYVYIYTYVCVCVCILLAEIIIKI